jgi:2-isopropylmalate synthase
VSTHAKKGRRSRVPAKATNLLPSGVQEAHMAAQDQKNREGLIYDWNEVDPRPARRKVTLDDETLRDGLQSPSVFDPAIEEKIEILSMMDALHIDTANIGLPGAGPRAVADVTRLAEAIRDGKLRIKANCAARTHLNDVEPIARIVQKTGVPIMASLFIGSSEIRRYTEDWSIERMLENSTKAIDFAVKEGLEVMYVTEDTTRAAPATIDRLYRTAIDHGASRLCICDTVGHVEPRGVHALVRHMRTLVASSGRPDVKLDWHGHNDRGLGLINALAAVEAGVDQVHGCALGIGERCGNTSMDQLIVNLRLMGWIDESLDLTTLPRYVKKVSEACRVPLPRNYPVMGSDAFETATGVHAAAVIKALKKQDTWLADRVYSGVPAGVFGLEQSITIGPMSGRSNVSFWLERRGFEATDALVDKIFDAAKRSSRILTEEEVLALAGLPQPAHV